MPQITNEYTGEPVTFEDPREFKFGGLLRSGACVFYRGDDRFYFDLQAAESLGLVSAEQAKEERMRVFL